MATTSTPVAMPWYVASLTTPVTPYDPALVGADALPLYVIVTERPDGTVSAVTVRADPLYVWFRFSRVTPAGALITLNVFVTFGAASQFASPVCDATI